MSSVTQITVRPSSVWNVVFISVWCWIVSDPKNSCSSLFCHTLHAFPRVSPELFPSERPVCFWWCLSDLSADEVWRGWEKCSCTALLLAVFSQQVKQDIALRSWPSSSFTCKQNQTSADIWITVCCALNGSPSTHLEMLARVRVSLCVLLTKIADIRHFMFMMAPCLSSAANCCYHCLFNSWLFSQMFDLFFGL